MKTIDFHTHVLPGADHGSDSLQTSLKQIELAKEASVDVIVATPHFYPHRHKLSAFLKRREASYLELKGATDATVLCGAEVLLCEKFENFENIDSLCIEGTKTILLELPFSAFKESYINTVEELIERGYDIVLAHAERYPVSSIDSLLAVGAKIQLNASALSGIFVKKHIKRWLAAKDVVAIGSDIHMVSKKHYGSLIKARKKLKGAFGNIMECSKKYLNL